MCSDTVNYAVALMKISEPMVCGRCTIIRLSFSEASDYRTIRVFPQTIFECCSLGLLTSRIFGGLMGQGAHHTSSLYYPLIPQHNQRKKQLVQALRTGCAAGEQRRGLRIEHHKIRLAAHA